MNPYDRPLAENFKLEDDGSLVFMQTKTSTVHVDKPETTPYSELRIWGVTGSGHSVVLLERKFKPYFYVKLPAYLNTNTVTTALRTYLAREFPDEVPMNSFIHSVSLVKRKSIMGYDGKGQVELVRLAFCAPRYVAKARDALEDGVVTNGTQCPTYEANVLFKMRYMVDIGLSGCQWLRCPPNSFTWAPSNGEDRRQFRTSLVAISTDYTKLCPIPTTVRGELAPWRWLSYDIEACRYKPGFVKAEEDPITQVCIVLEEEGKGIIYKKAFCLGPGCDELLGVDLSVYATENEGEMLKDIRQFIVDSDPDFITGWNVDKFDHPYMFNRAKALKVFKVVCNISRDTLKHAYVKPDTIKSKAYGTIKTNKLVCEGRSSYDGYMHTRLRERLGLRSYGLNSVAMTVLDTGGKVDVPHWQIPILQQGTNADRAYLTHYCMVDAEKPLEILNKRMVKENIAEQARVTGVDFCELLGGEGKKTFSKVLRSIKARGITLPSQTPSQNKKKTKGGLVFVPKRGYYVKQPVVTNDFRSLYPSIMSAENVGYSSFCTIEFARKHFKTTDYNIPPIENVRYCFVGKHIFLAVMAEVVDDLLGARGTAKWDMKMEQDPKKKAVLDARQVALKLCCNSVYGFFKAFYLCQMECMEAICAWGRQMLRLSDLKTRFHFTPEHTQYIHKIAPTAMNIVYGFLQRDINAGELDLANARDWRVQMMLHLKADIVDTDSVLVYGDSVTHDTPCLLQNADTGEIFLETISNFVGDNAWETRGDGKEVAKVPDNIRVWTDDMWTPIVQIIRHRVAKRIYRVLTHTGVVDVTEDHSLLDSKAEKIAAGGCVVGKTLLLHAYPKMTPIDDFRVDYDVVPRNTDEAMAWGFFMADGSCGTYNCPSGVKSSWAINNSNYSFLVKAQKALNVVETNVQFKILETMQSSGVYKLVPKGKVKEIVQRYRALFYDSEKYKVVPTCILNAPLNIQKGFWKGYYLGDGDKDPKVTARCDLKGKIGAAGMFYLMKTLGYKVSINTRKDKPHMYRLNGTKAKQRKNQNVVKRIREITDVYAGKYVYDLETQNHHFQAGVGQMIVHNTDSVMHTFGEMTEDRANYLGTRAAHLCTAYFDSPNKLEFEAVKCPAIFIEKKRYIAREREYKGSKGKMKYQGETSARRDNCPFEAKLQMECAKLLMRDKSDGGPDVLRSIRLLHSECRRLLQCKVDISDLVMSASFSKTVEEYEEGGSRPAHVELWKKKRARAHITGEYLESTGDRIPYVVMPAINTGSMKAGKWERVEDPEYCMRNGLYPDPQWYLEKMKKSFLRLFSPVFTGDLTQWMTPEIRADPLVSKLFESEQTTVSGKRIRLQERVTKSIATSTKKQSKLMAHKILFEGRHMHARVHKSITTEARQQKKAKTGGSLAMFVTKGKRCLACKGIIREGRSPSNALCRECLPKQVREYSKVLKAYNIKEVQFNEAWTRCQRCQGSLHKLVVCGNRDCDNFYRRIALQIDIEDLAGRLKRF